MATTTTYSWTNSTPSSWTASFTLASAQDWESVEDEDHNLGVAAGDLVTIRHRKTEEIIRALLITSVVVDHADQLGISVGRDIYWLDRWEIVD